MALSIELTPANARNNPLPDVARQVQNEIADGVGCFVRTPPDAGLVEWLEAAFDLRQVVFDKKLSSAGDESFSRCGNRSKLLSDSVDSFLGRRSG